MNDCMMVMVVMKKMNKMMMMMMMIMIIVRTMLDPQTHVSRSWWQQVTASGGAGQEENRGWPH